MVDTSVARSSRLIDQVVDLKVHVICAPVTVDTVDSDKALSSGSKLDGGENIQPRRGARLGLKY